VAVHVTWTKLFVFAGTLIAGMYGITAYVDSVAEGRQARDVASLRKDLDDTLAQLAARGGEADDKLRKDLLDALELRTTHVEERLGGLDAKLDQLRTDMLVAIAKGPNPPTAPPSTP
jgi:hypothetical protein